MRRYNAVDGTVFGALEAGEGGYVHALRVPYGYLDILAVYGRTDPLVG